MKHRIYIAVGMALLTATPSCTKFIEYSPREDYQITADDYFKTADDYQKMLIGVYSPLQWLWAVPVIGDVASDNSVSGGENATDVLGLQQIDDYTTISVNSYMTEIWKTCYEGINRANYLEENKGKLEFAGKEQVYAQVYF
ncbi:hypothetical protein, partial [Flavihumibacter sp. CACIAM 22H1]|uniref:hypothetical protein n=1 Tax=Flavihumibacter sp. CACIAM 22H1 TaxID=1812911 RepID=UPI0025C68CE0